MPETINLSAALAIFDDQLADIRKACVLNAQAIQARPHKELDIDADWTQEDIHLAVEDIKIQEQLHPLTRVIGRIDGRKKHYTGSITEADIERAREYPIEDLWSELVGTPVRHGMAHCCFHNDNTESLSLRKHNRYKCFGCDAKGDVIDLYMKLNGVDFITAVKKLV